MLCLINLLHHFGMLRLLLFYHFSFCFVGSPSLKLNFEFAKFLFYVVDDAAEYSCFFFMPKLGIIRKQNISICIMSLIAGIVPILNKVPG